MKENNPLESGNISKPLSVEQVKGLKEGDQFWMVSKKVIYGAEDRAQRVMGPLIVENLDTRMPLLPPYLEFKKPDGTSSRVLVDLLVHENEIFLTEAEALGSSK